MITTAKIGATFFENWSVVLGSKARQLRRNQAQWVMNEARNRLMPSQDAVLDAITHGTGFIEIEEMLKDPEFQRIHREVREAGEVPKEIYDKHKFFNIVEK